MRLGKDAIVFSRRMDVMSVGLLSQTYLKSIKAETVLVPIVSWDLPNSILWFVNRLRQYTKDNAPKTFAVTSSDIFDERIVTVRNYLVFDWVWTNVLWFHHWTNQLKCYNGQGYCPVVGINSLYTATCFMRFEITVVGQVCSGKFYQLEQMDLNSAKVIWFSLHYIYI